MSFAFRSRTAAVVLRLVTDAGRTADGLDVPLTSKALPGVRAGCCATALPASGAVSHFAAMVVRAEVMARVVPEQVVRFIVVTPEIEAIPRRDRILAGLVFKWGRAVPVQASSRAGESRSCVAT